MIYGGISKVGKNFEPIGKLKYYLGNTFFQIERNVILDSLNSLINTSGSDGRILEKLSVGANLENIMGTYSVFINNNNSNVGLNIFHEINYPYISLTQKNIVYCSYLGLGWYTLSYS